MVSLDSQELSAFPELLQPYDAEATLARIAGLLACPTLQANTIRIETLVHLAVLHCRGTRRPTPTELRKWLSRTLGGTQIAMLEDPAEDVFITNVEAPQGNFRLFEGIWEANAYFVQVVLETLASEGAPQACKDLLPPALALLRISECIAERLSLPRWRLAPSKPKGDVTVPRPTVVETLARAVTFTPADLVALGVTRESLIPFVFRNEDRDGLASQTTGHTSLERRPLVSFAERIVFALPHCASPAVRRFVLESLHCSGHLRAFSSAMGRKQARQLHRDALREFQGTAEPLESPPADGRMPSLHGWLIRYDLGRYLHVVLLHDNMSELAEGGLSTFREYPEEIRESLEKYLSKVAEHCRELPEFARGVTLLVTGGLGRGFALGLVDWPAGWHMAVVRLADLLIMADELGEPVRRFIKCIEQRDWAESKGVAFINMNGDYNFYCHWRQLKCQLVPRELPVADGSGVVIATDMVRPVREEVRNLLDRHVARTASGAYSPVMRLGRDTYFTSMHKRPIYASIGHLMAGTLGGVVETRRGSSWLLVIPPEQGELLHRVFYELWSGFMNFHERVVVDVESRFPGAPRGPVEVQLDFSSVRAPDESRTAPTSFNVTEPQLDVDLAARTVRIAFPSDFLTLFEQAANAGERSILRSIAHALVSLHGGTSSADDAQFIDALLDRVLVGDAARVLHMFRTHYPIEHLLSRRGQQPRFLSHEDFVFSKLQLWEGCIPPSTPASSSITGTEPCNSFLHKVVEKTWHAIRGILRQLDRAAVIREALAVHEAVNNDRDHWRRTAQAVIAIYSSAEDVFSVAEAREKDRNQIALAARTVLEMALCECPEAGGRRASRHDMDELFAKAAVMIEAATDSDAVHGGLSDARVFLHPNGEYEIDRSFQKTVIRPFVAGHFREEFEDAAGEYPRLYRQRDPDHRARADNAFSRDFSMAFEAEYGLTTSEAIEGWAKLLDAAVEADSVIVETTVGAVRNRLVSVANLSPRAAESFMRAFSLYGRESWEVPPAGFKTKDLHPWRYRRRLSVSTKPILAFGAGDGDKVFYGAATLRTSIGYLLSSSEEGRFPPEFFASKEMKRYVGSVNDERGRAFTLSVAETIRGQGWLARTEVQMTELGASAEFGDIDVLAWKPGSRVQLIECKRLRLARTVAEIAEICGRFRGEAKDELAKHVRRAEWIARSPACLSRIVGFTPSARQIRTRLVTDTHVPMMYLRSLPLRPENIGPLEHAAS
ncbi:conserved hypothetical protein [Anaeromyxobacter sp. K]|uniref:hypothetical protein n=1 Tax=Anaeromyxobacter sp. (strain K) TaxID=447217 RepID=UPI00017BE378|nr:hypothetical protein [Anaeromyxobacter sp. K]ACG74560.1 conserved hypothetical protein [Anaeromyxobacter sp. K]